MWTSEQYAQARIMKNNGHNHREIAAALGLSHDAVRKYFSRELERERRQIYSAGRQYPRQNCPWTKGEHDNILKWAREGRPPHELAALSGRTEPAVMTYLRKQGCPIVAKPPITARQHNSAPIYYASRHEKNKAFERAKGCVWHLIDLMRATGCEYLEDAIEAYEIKNELNIDNGYARLLLPSGFQGSACGSSAAMCSD